MLLPRLFWTKFLEKGARWRKDLANLSKYGVSVKNFEFLEKTYYPITSPHLTRILQKSEKRRVFGNCSN